MQNQTELMDQFDAHWAKYKELMPEFAEAYDELPNYAYKDVP